RRIRVLRRRRRVVVVVKVVGIGRRRRRWRSYERRWPMLVSVHLGFVRRKELDSRRIEVLRILVMADS
ncbi:hypothetical protein LINPERHAP1_LOCUS35523, partial [Linum perenne]